MVWGEGGASIKAAKAVEAFIAEGAMRALVPAGTARRNRGDLGAQSRDGWLRGEEGLQAMRCVRRQGRAAGDLRGIRLQADACPERSAITTPGIKGGFPKEQKTEETDTGRGDFRQNNGRGGQQCK